jgi:Carboxypeptidase regulatory-like domain
MRTSIAFSILLTLALGPGCANHTQPEAAKSKGPLVLDLSKLQTEKFVTDGKTNSYWQTVAGRQTFDGLPFQIEGRGCVYGTKLGAEMLDHTNTHPDFVGIQIGRKFGELHLLHVTQWADVEGQDIAFIRLNYADGSKAEIPIRFGGQVRDWHRMPSEEKELLTDPNTKVVWRAPGVARIKSTLRLFKTMLPNPHPEKVVTTMDVVSTKHLAGYDLIAATVADRDPSRAVTPPCPPEGGERKFDGTLTVQVIERGSGKPVPDALLQATMNVDDVSVICIPLLTSTTGEGVIRYPTSGAKSVSVTVEREGFSSGRGATDVDSGPTNSLEVQLGSRPRLNGIVRDSTGAALEGVELTLWPDWRANSKATKSDKKGHFSMPWNPQNMGNQDYEICLVARDLKRNLAFAQVVDEETKDLDLRLEPALAVAGRATGPGGKVLTNVQVELTFWSERMGSSFGKPTPAAADGRFEIKALPTGRRYGVTASAKGYGRVSRDVAKDVEGSRVKLEPCELTLADQRIAGVVVDADEKPVGSARVFGSGEGQPNINAQTDAKGRFSFEAVCAGTIRLFANGPSGGYANLTTDGGDTNITIQLQTSQSVSSSRQSFKISGAVTDPDGKPVPKAAVSVFPSHSQAEKPANAEGRFSLTYDPNQFSYMGETAPTVVGRDVSRNLAAAVNLDEGATNANLRLEPALTLVCRVTDAEGKPLTNAQGHAQFHTERQSFSFGAPIRADAEGRFEIKALPLNRRYSVVVSAKGFGQERRTVEAADTATNRLELTSFQLLRANQLLAGVVLDQEDKPVAHASVYTYGEGQPNLNTQTDAKGHFTMEKVCPGPIQFSVNTRSGGYAIAVAEGGDTNVTIRLGASSGMRGVAHREASLKGKPLPDLAPLGFTAAETPADQPLLALLIDAEQRPSRRAVRALGEQAASFKEKGLTVVVLHAGTMTDDAFKAWKEEAAVPFPVGCLKGDAEKARATWGARALPWLILTDKSHRVTAEGFDLDELDAKLKDAAK